VRFVDYGGDVERFTEAGWLKMARRVWLSARHPERSDLKELMRRSLTDGGLPELDGLDAFLRVDPLASKVALLDTRLEAIVGGLGARRVIDVGCGTGWLAAALAAGGAEVTGYDPDPALAQRWLHLAPGIRFCHRPGFDAILAAGETFDAVVCALVLCDIDDDGEALGLIGALARLAAPDGHVVVAVCNPDHVGRSTNLQRREPPADAGVRCVTWKTLRPTGVRRRDVHRPRWMLATAFAEVGLQLVDSDETASFDPDTLEPSSDFLILHFRRTDAGRTA